LSEEALEQPTMDDSQAMGTLGPFVRF
jgi:hypothetical protein